MSHEIRTPLNAVIGMTELLAGTRLTPEQAKFVAAVRGGGKTLLGVVNDILDFSRIDSAGLQLERAPFEPRRCVEETLDLLAAEAARKGLDLRFAVDVEVPGDVLGDVTRTRQVLVNLVGNAVKFTDAGKVLVSLRSRRIDESSYELHFSVEDTGIGIPAARLGDLFTSFTQVDASTTRKYGGTGLGLAISRRLAELMGGIVWAESVEGVGSTFHFTVVAEAAASRPRLERATRPGSEPPEARLSSEIDPDLGARAPLRILLAEDNDLNREVALGLLALMGYSADVARNGAEAVDAVRRAPYDVVLMDVQMPEMDGLEAARRILREHRDGRPRLVAMTAHALRGDREACLAAGMDDYLSKPVRVEDLQAALRRARPEAPPPGGAFPTPALAGANGVYAKFRSRYLDESAERLGEVAELLGRLATDPAGGDAIGKLSRILHHLAGTGGSFGLPRVTALGRSGEALCARLRAEGDPAALDEVRALCDAIREAFEEAVAGAGGAAELETGGEPGDAPTGEPRDPGPAVPRAGAPTDGREPGRILLVEGDGSEAADVRSALEGAGFQVAVCSDAARAGRAAEEFGPDLVLIDVDRTDATCDEQASCPCRDGALAAFNAVFLTSDGQASPHSASLRARGRDVLAKPVPRELLVATARSRVERSRILNGVR